MCVLCLPVYHSKSGSVVWEPLVNGCDIYGPS